MASMTLRCCVVAALAFSTFAPLARGAMLPHDSVQQMCMSSDLIVAGAKVGDTKVLLTDVFYASGTAPQKEDTIEVPALSAHTRVLGWTSHPKGDIETNRVFLFLLRSKDGRFAPINFCEPGARGCSGGIRRTATAITKR